MRRLSAHYIITNEGPPLNKGIIDVGDDGTITGVHDTGGDLKELASVEFYNGIIIPGFVNCHCHLELSHMKDLIPRESGLSEFLRIFRNARISGTEKITDAASLADAEMYSDGTQLCADISNTNHTFNIKKNSRISYINLLEVFGIDPLKASLRIDEIMKLADEAQSEGLRYSVVPHSAYSISLTLFNLLHEVTATNKITSIHFMETEAEKMLLENHEGPLMDSYRESELVSDDDDPELVSDHVTAVLDYITRSGNLILVHNTFAGSDTIKKLKGRKDLFWCLCPKANLYIENHIPPLDIFLEEECNIVIGTDSYASNNKLDILDELKVLQENFPTVTLEELIRFATINGAKALDGESLYGSVKPGKKPGLLLLKDLDLHNLRLLPESNIKRLI